MHFALDVTVACVVDSPPKESYGPVFVSLDHPRYACGVKRVKRFLFGKKVLIPAIFLNWHRDCQSIINETKIL
jgi:hypothetical protein